MRVSELWIRNFKSLRDVRLELNQFNLVVGPNGSGKTNLIDALEFLRESLAARGMPRPWRRWWRPENVVWIRDETLPLAFGFKFEAGEYRASYEVTCSVTGGEFRIEGEVLSVEGWGKLERAGSTLSVSYEDVFIEKAEKSGVERELLEPEEVKGVLGPRDSLVRNLPISFLRRRKDIGAGFELLRFHLLRGGELTLVVPRLEKSIIGRELIKLRRPLLPPSIMDNLVAFLCYMVRAVIGGIVIVRPLNLQALRKPQEYVRTLQLESDCSNLYIVLYNLFLRRNRLPDRIAKVLSVAFKDYELLFDLTEDGRVFVKLVHDDLTLPPPCMPDGFHKLVAVLTALELRPSILAIDELENSLHPRLVELIVDLLKSSDTVVIATTHSPAAVDIAEPEDLVLAEMTGSGTVFRRLRNTAKIREELKRYGITLSERWLWGRVEVE